MRLILEEEGGQEGRRREGEEGGSGRKEKEESQAAALQLSFFLICLPTKAQARIPIMPPSIQAMASHAGYAAVGEQTIRRHDREEDTANTSSMFFPHIFAFLQHMPLYKLACADMCVGVTWQASRTTQRTTAAQRAGACAPRRIAPLRASLAALRKKARGGAAPASCREASRFLPLPARLPTAQSAELCALPENALRLHFRFATLCTAIPPRTCAGIA